MARTKNRLRRMFILSLLSGYMIFSTERFIENTHNQMIENHMYIFRHLHTHDICVQRNISQLTKPASPVSGEPDDLIALLLCVFYCVQDILGIAAAGNGDNDIPFLQTVFS